MCDLIIDLQQIFIYLYCQIIIISLMSLSTQNKLQRQNQKDNSKESSSHSPEPEATLNSQTPKQQQQQQHQRERMQKKISGRSSSPEREELFSSSLVEVYSIRDNPSGVLALPEKEKSEVGEQEENEKINSKKQNGFLWRGVEGWKNMAEEDRKRFMACGLWLVGCTCWVVAYLYPNMHNVSPQVTNIWRSSLIIVVNYLICTQLKHQSLDIIDEGQYFWCIIRMVLLCVNLFLFTLSQFYLPLPVLHTINCTSPIFTILFDWLLYKRRLTKQQTKGVFLSFIGILFIILFAKQPSYQANDTKFANYIEISEISKFFLIILMLMNAAGFGYACVITKKMERLHSSVILFYAGSGLMLSSGFFYPLSITPQLSSQKTNDALPGEEDIPLDVYIGGFFVSGVIFAFGQVCEMMALKLSAETGRILIMENFTVVVAYIVSICFLDEPFYFLCFLGVLMAIAGVIKTIK